MSDYLNKRRHEKTFGKPIEPKKTYRIPKKSAKKLAQEKEEKEKGTGKVASKLSMDKWFLDISLKHTKSYSGGGGCFCMECSSFIPVNFMRHATAHLLPKKLFTSVATHPLNYLILGAGCGCHEKTHRVDKFIKMKVWPEAARRIKEMIPLLPFDELKFLSSQLLTALHFRKH